MKKLSTISLRKYQASEQDISVCALVNITWLDFSKRGYFLKLRICVPSLSTSGDRDSSVGIATGYVMDGPGFESRWWRDFSHTSRPMYSGYQVFRGGWAEGVWCWPLISSSAEVKKDYRYTSTPICVFRSVTGYLHLYPVVFILLIFSVTRWITRKAGYVNYFIYDIV
jgi:hypothetical protein